MKIRKIAALLLSAALLCEAAFAAEETVTAAENGTVLPGAVSGIARLGENYIVTDVSNKLVWQMDADGAFTLSAGYVSAVGADGEPVGAYRDGTVESAQFMEPWDVAPFLDGYVVSDASANVVRYVADGMVRSACGSGTAGYKDGSGKGVLLDRPTGLAADDEGNVYIADTNNGAIRLLSPNGEVKTVLVDLVEPTGLCWNDGVLYIAETGRSRIVSFANGKFSVIAGGETKSDGEYPMGFADGKLENARFAAPQGIAVGNDGCIYVADTDNSAIRRIKDGVVTTMLRSQNGARTPAKPRGLAVIGTKLFVTDYFARASYTVSLSFEDVSEDDWFASSVEEMTARGIFTGVSEDEFAPAGSLTRAMFVTVLSRIQLTRDSESIIRGESVFSDVAPGSWYENAVNWAAENGVAQGANGSFAPNRSITRQELVTMLYRYAVQFGLDVSAEADLSAFADASEISDYAVSATRWAVGAGIVSGVSADRLAPQGTATRAEAAKLFSGLLKVCEM